MLLFWYSLPSIIRSLVLWFFFRILTSKYIFIVLIRTVIFSSRHIVRSTVFQTIKFLLLLFVSTFSSRGVKLL